MTPDPRILITGATGFLGRAVLRRARDRGLDARGCARRGVGATLAVDLTSPEPVRNLLDNLRPDIVIDCAGVVPGPAGGAVDQNIAITETLLSAATGSDTTPTIVFAGSAAIYGHGAPQDRATREDDPHRPFGDYGRAKLAALNLVQSAVRDGQDARTGIVFNLMGPGQPPHLAPQAMIERCITGPHPIEVGPAGAVRDFLHVGDAADALLALALQGDPGTTVNIASGRPTRMSDLFDHVCQRFGTRWVTQGRATDDFVCYGDSRKLQHMTDWRPRFDLEGALAQTIAHTVADLEPSP